MIIWFTHVERELSKGPDTDRLESDGMDTDGNTLQYVNSAVELYLTSEPSLFSLD